MMGSVSAGPNPSTMRNVFLKHLPASVVPVAVLLLLAVALVACSDQSPSASAPQLQGKISNGSGKLSDSEEQLLRRAAESEFAEFVLAKWMVLKGSDQQVQQYADRMVNRSRDCLNGVVKLSHEKGITVSQQITPQDRELMRKVMALKGSELNAAYLEAVIDRHRLRIATLRRQSQSIQDRDVKSCVRDRMQTLASDLDDALTLGNRLGTVARSRPPRM